MRDATETLGAQTHYLDDGAVSIGNNQA